MRIGDFDPMDRKFWPSSPEPGFSVERNKRVIEGTIKKYEKHRAKIMANFEDNLRERTDAAIQYLMGGGGAARSKSVEKYFGKTQLAYLRGEDIRNKLMQERMSVITKPEVLAEEKESQEHLKKFVKRGKGYKIRRTNGQKAKKRKKKI